MKISELKSVMESILKYAGKVRLQDLFNRFNGAITQTLKQKQPVEVGQHKTALFKALENFDWEKDLTYGEQQLFSHVRG